MFVYCRLRHLGGLCAWVIAWKVLDSLALLLHRQTLFLGRDLCKGIRFALGWCLCKTTTEPSIGKAPILALILHDVLNVRGAFLQC